MWLLHLLPDAFLAFVVDAVLLLGIVSTVVTCFLLKYLIRFVPALAPQIRLIQIISVIVLLAGVYFRGGYSAEMSWRERVQEVEAQLALAQQQSQAANDKLSKQSQQKIQNIHSRQIVVKQYIDREVTKYDNQCVIPKEFVQAHNQAAEKTK